MHLRTMLFVLAILGVFALAAAPTHAKKPPKPGDEEPPAPADPAIAYVGLDGPSGGYADLRVMDADGGNAVTLLSGVAHASTHADWSPDGQEIAFNGSAPTSGIWAVGVDGAGLRQLVGLASATGAQPSWSPTACADANEWILYARSIPEDQGAYDLFLVDPNSGDELQLTDTATVSEEYPVWSSDATSLATVENHFDGSEDIVLFDVVVGTTGALELRRTANVTALAAGTLGSVDSFSHLDWAKDGDAIAFAASAPGSLRDIWVLDVTTPTSPTATKLTNTARNSEFAPTWSEDDTSIAYRKNGKGKDQGIFIVSATGGTATALLAGGDNTQPSWRR